MLSHGIVDLLTHRTSAYNHFFPLLLPPVRSVVSYTDPGFTILEHTALLLFLVWVFARRRMTKRALAPEGTPGVAASPTYNRPRES
jgi:hypothetical protein